MKDLTALRESMVRSHIAARGLTDARVLDAMLLVPRECFLPSHLAEFAYDDTPLPIEEGQTISQPYIVALMIALVRPKPRDRVLEIGTGSGYAAAVLSRVVAEVYTVERHEPLADQARHRLESLGYDNVHILHGDGSLGWPEHAPFDAIIVTAGGPHVPRQLREQLAVGGRMVIPVGADPREQRLVRITRRSEDRFEEEQLEQVRFVPLVGEDAWEGPGVVAAGGIRPAASSRGGGGVAPSGVGRADPDDRRGGPRTAARAHRTGASVLIGEASHGTSEFYRMRARITRELVARRGFTIVAAEADWPDAARIDRYVRHGPSVQTGAAAFTRFPTWMWRNAEVHDFVEWLRGWNAEVPDPRRRAGFYGLDLYSLFTSIAAVLRYLDEIDPESAAVARRRYACLSPWERDPAVYGRAAITGQYRTCEEPVTRMLSDLLARRLDYAQRDGERFLDAAQNARLVANAERYYRVMYYGQGRLLESPRPAHVRHPADAAQCPGPGVEGGGLGAQLPCRQRWRDRDERPGRIQYRRAVPRALRRPMPSWSASGPTTAPSPRPRIGTSRCRSWPSAPRTPRATNDCSTRPAGRRSCCRSAPPPGLRCARSCARRAWSAPSA